jgi:hypothetical protein
MSAGAVPYRAAGAPCFLSYFWRVLMCVKRNGVAALLAAGLFAGAVQADTVIDLDPPFPGDAEEVTCEGDNSCSGLINVAPWVHGVRPPQTFIARRTAAKPQNSSN